MIRGSQRGLPLEINQIKIQKNFSGTPRKEISYIPTEEMLIDKYTELLDFKKFEKVKDRMDISLRKKL
jgi:hypothetical protein